MNLYIKSASTEGEGTPNIPSPSIAYNDLRVYVAADKFGIEPLKTLAKQRFITWANSNWSSAAFPAVVREVFASIPVQSQVFARLLSGSVRNTRRPS